MTYRKRNKEIEREGGGGGGGGQKNLRDIALARETTRVGERTSSPFTISQPKQN